MRRKTTIDTLLAEKQILEEKDPTLKFYEIKENSFIAIKPEDVNTSGYWKLKGRKVKKGEKITSYVVSGSGGRAPWGEILYTRFLPAFHISQTEEIRYLIFSDAQLEFIEKNQSIIDVEFTEEEKNFKFI